MACKTHFKFLTQLLICTILMAMTLQAAGTRGVPKPKKDAKDADVKHPDGLVTIEPLPTVLIPGVGRFIMPPKSKCKKFFKPTYPYNPVTGEPLTGGSISGEIPTYGGGQAGRTQIPGGDDTLVPNPGYGVPDSGNGAGVPASGNGAGVPASDNGAGVPASGNGAGVPDPSNGAGIPSPVNDAGVPSPVNNSGVPAPVNDAGTPAPVIDAGIPAPGNGAGIPAPVKVPPVPQP